MDKVVERLNQFWNYGLLNVLECVIVSAEKSAAG